MYALDMYIFLECNQALKQAMASDICDLPLIYVLYALYMHIRLLYVYMIVIYSNDEDEKDEKLAGFLHTSIVMESFKDNLAKLMRRALKRKHRYDGFVFLNAELPWAIIPRMLFYEFQFSFGCGLLYNFYYL